MRETRHVKGGDILGEVDILDGGRDSCARFGIDIGMDALICILSIVLKENAFDTPACEVGPMVSRKLRPVNCGETAFDCAGILAVSGNNPLVVGKDVRDADGGESVLCGGGVPIFGCGGVTDTSRTNPSTANIWDATAGGDFGGDFVVRRFLRSEPISLRGEGVGISALVPMADCVLQDAGGLAVCDPTFALGGAACIRTIGRLTVPCISLHAGGGDIELRLGTFPS